MKLNKLFMGLAAMAIVGCSSDDLNVAAPEQAAEDSRLVELNSNFVLAGVGVEDTGTRTHWDWAGTPGSSALVNKFLPTYAIAPAAGKYLYKVDPATAVNDQYANLDDQVVGLCWLGQGAPGTDVYTNYQFYHFGWLNVDQTSAEFDCGELTNGSMYSDITFAAAAGAVGDEANPANFTLLPKSAGGLNYNSGVYKTDNKAIFGGNYIVYYPFNENFKEAGTIPAIAETVFGNPAGTGVSTALNTKELCKATFRYSSPVEIKGGDQAADFGLYNLSTLVQLRVAAAKGYTGTTTIDQIVLYSENKQLLKQANLAADKIVAGKKGAELYAKTEGTKTIVANFVASGVTLKATDATPTSAYITVLPTTVEDLVVLVHSNSLNKWAKVSLPNTVFEAGKAKRLDITVADADFKADFIAVDDASLRKALTEANAVAAAATPATITVIGDITLGNDLFINTATYPNSKFINVTGDDIIVPQDVLFRLETNMVSDVRVLGRSCCTGTWGGRLEIQGGTVNNVTMEETEAKVADAADYFKKNPLVTYSGAATIAAGKTFDVQAGNVYVNEAVEQKEGNIQIAEGAKLIVNQDGLNKGNLSFLGTTVDNYGTIEVMKAGQFYMKNANGTSVWSDGQKMTNHATGKFIHNVDAVVGTAVQFMNQETGSEYRCRVDKQKALDDAYVQWTACSVIEMVNSGAAITYDLGSAVQHTIWGSLKHVDIEVNNIDITGPTIYKTTFQKNAETKEINIGNLTVMTPLDVDDQENATTHAQRSLKVNGNMTVSANTDLKNSKKITVTGDLDIDNAATLTYAGSKKIVEGLAVGGNITVTDAANFNASAAGGILISCQNFSLSAGATATFGNRTAGDSANKTMEVKGTISNGKGCTFTISPATGGNLLAWITCYKTEGAGTYAGTPTVIKP